MTGLIGQLLAGLTVATVLVASGPPSQKLEPAKPAPSAASGLAGWLLVAAPRMRDPRFDKTVIFMVHHDDQSALGLVVNRLLAVEPASRLLQPEGENDETAEKGRNIRIQYGGPVEPNQAFFLHSNDYADKATVAVTRHISMTTSREVLHALAAGKGPAKGFLAMGYAGWGPGQLERELKAKAWVTIPSEGPLVFDDDMESKWQRAMTKRGVDL